MQICIEHNIVKSQWNSLDAHMVIQTINIFILSLEVLFLSELEDKWVTCKKS